MSHSHRLRSFLSAVRRRWFAQEILTVLGRASASAAVPGFAALILDRLFAPGGAAEVVLASAAIAAALGAAAIVTWRMQRRPDDRQVARFVEEKASSLPGGVAFEDALVTAADVRASSEPGFGPLLVARAIERLEGVTPALIIPAARLRRAGLEAACGLAALALVLAFGAAPLGNALEALRVSVFPETILVDVQPGDTRVVAGEPVRIRAVIRSGERVLTKVEPVLVVTAGASQRSVPMTADGESFSFPFESVDRTFTYAVTAGGTRSREFTVTALFPPRVDRIELRYEYPPFTGLRPHAEENGGDIYAPAGTKVRVRVHADKPVVSGRMSFEEGGAKPLAPAGDGVLETELVLAHDDAYRVSLADADGLRTTGETEYFIRLMDDRPPEVRIVRPAADRQITPLEEVAIEARADDDYGISSLELVYAVPGGRTHAVPFATVTGSGETKLGAHLLAAEELGVKPGDVITYYARARDVGRGKRPTEARSDMYFLEVRPFGEEFVAAQSQGRGGPASAQIETLIAAQKEIINATWNVERRSSAGRSAKDVEAIALAQAELKARAEQLVSRRGRGGRFEAPQQVAPQTTRGQRPGARDPVAEAIQAMGRAVEQLQATQTREALPHEMAALQGLLQAQAEVRRREVMQQQASGSASGAGRQGEDLSALFDKELQRQQRTNYESTSQIEQRPDRQPDAAIDRLRDLARRQEEMARQQQELTDASLTPEERQRRLERLTREQSELRERVEELAKQMSRNGQEGAERQSRQGSADGPRREGQGDRQGLPGAGGPLKDASNQMREAAGALGRDDAKTAAEQSARAADELRRAEQQLRDDSPEARRRAAGELGLEAQQIAGEQRRIASEAGRLDRSGDADTADARRRLAGEKDALADRTDALQRAAEGLAKGQPAGAPRAGDGPQVADAARELQKQQLGRRMRETAGSMREGTGGRMADAEEQIARAIDRVVEQMGAGEGDARQLTGQLDETRGIRDRLDRLERRLREAEAAQRTAGRDGRTGSGAQQAEIERLRQEYARELRQARETLARLESGAPRSGEGGSTPETHEWSQADPGTQGYKQDFSAWQSLRKDIDLALERTEAAVSARLARQAARDRLSAGGSDRVPDAYRELVARYYEALVRARK